ncbi:ankyrin repeat-containing domain protein [Aspergillus carlsbadensis]|nr:ankyrin repeat-containing domain protein [Aspergillus carlsbadensis]
MRLPPEILLLIISKAEHTHSPLELFKARLVNKLFADQIMTLASITTFLDTLYSQKWETIPYRLLYSHARQKIKQHKEYPTYLSFHVHDVLNLCAETLNTYEKKELFIANAIRSVHLGHPRRAMRLALTMRPDCHRSWATACRIFAGRLNTPHEDMCIVFICTAIERGDVVELDQLLSDPRNKSVSRSLNEHSSRWHVNPLCLVAKYGSKTLMDVLIKHGVQYNDIFWDRLRYPITLAAEYGNRLAMEGWIKDRNVPYRARDLENAMRVALRGPDFETVRSLEKHYPEKGLRRSTFLYEASTVAIQYGHVDIVKYLLDVGGFDVNMRTHRFQLGLMMTPLLQCDRSLILQLIWLLLEHGVDPTYVPSENRHNEVAGTPLQRACILGHLEVVKALVKYGADVNASCKGRHGRWHGVCTPPPLWHAMRHPDGGEMVRGLLEYGADSMFRLRWKTVLVQVDDNFQQEGEKDGNQLKHVLWRGNDYEMRDYSLAVVEFHRRKEARKKEKATITAKSSLCWTKGI